MIETILMCLIVAYAQDCTTLHPSLDQFIPKDLLPEDNLFHSNPIINNNNNETYLCMLCMYV